MSEPVNKKKWLAAKKLANEIYARPSAYKSGFIVKKYKELGGTFKTPRKEVKGLTRWFAEKWVNQRGEVGYKRKSDVYRPSKRITTKTPITWKELSDEEITRARRTKSKELRVKRFVVKK